MKKYEAPRAVRLRDAPTGTFACVSGSMYTADCVEGLLVSHDQCQGGSSIGW